MGRGVDFMRSFVMGKFVFNRARHCIAATALVLVLVACAPITNQRGNLPDPDLLSRIEPGAQSRDDVVNILGSPTSIASFGGEIWYYISSQTETIAFYEPEVVDQRVVAIAFDDDGMVASVRTYGLEDAQDIEPVARVTPTGGRELTFLEQLFGNIGRFVGKTGQEGGSGTP